MRLSSSKLSPQSRRSLRSFFQPRQFACICVYSRPDSGVTLIELLVTLAIISLLIGVSLPSVANGLTGIRLKGASSDVAALLTGALNRAERHEQTMEIIVYPKEDKMVLDSTEPGYTRTLTMPAGIHIVGENPMRILLMPGSAPPRVTIDLVTEHGSHRIVKLDPVTGVPEVAVPQ